MFKVQLATQAALLGIFALSLLHGAPTGILIAAVLCSMADWTTHFI